jgi:hypothetical protein
VTHAELGDDASAALEERSSERAVRADPPDPRLVKIIDMAAGLPVGH